MGVQGAAVGWCYCPQMLQYSGDFGRGGMWQILHEIIKPGPGLSLVVKG